MIFNPGKQDPALNLSADSPTMSAHLHYKPERMKSTFATFLFPMSTLMLGFLSALLLPAPWFGIVLTKKLMAIFHLADIGQLYTLVFCLWFLLLGAIEYFIIRFIYRRFIKI